MAAGVVDKSLASTKGLTSPAREEGSAIVAALAVDEASEAATTTHAEASEGPTATALRADGSSLRRANQPARRLDGLAADDSGRSRAAVHQAPSGTAQGRSSGSQDSDPDDLAGPEDRSRSDS